VRLPPRQQCLGRVAGRCLIASWLGNTADWPVQFSLLSRAGEALRTLSNWLAWWPDQPGRATVEGLRKRCGLIAVEVVNCNHAVPRMKFVVDALPPTALTTVPASSPSLRDHIRRCSEPPPPPGPPPPPRAPPNSQSDDQRNVQTSHHGPELLLWKFIGELDGKKKKPWVARLGPPPSPTVLPARTKPDSPNAATNHVTPQAAL